MWETGGRIPPVTQLLNLAEALSLCLCFFLIKDAAPEDYDLLLIEKDNQAGAAENKMDSITKEKKSCQSTDNDTGFTGCKKFFEIVKKIRTGCGTVDIV